jgi:hypothetical protein
MTSQQRRAALLALLATCACAGCAVDRPASPLIEAHLWKRAHPPVELSPGAKLDAGDELYMTVRSQRSLYLYVVNEDALRRRQILYPCRGWRRGHALASRRFHRLPPPLLGRATFWPVQTVTPHERLLVLGSGQPAAALEGAVLAAFDAPACAAPLDGSANRWLDGLIADSFGAARSPRDLRRGGWKEASSGQEGWMLAFDLAGPPGHG